MRIRTTSRPGASPHPISVTTATNNSVRSGHGRPHRQSWYTTTPQPSLFVWGADPAADAAITIPLAARRHASTNGEVTA
jgi:hypothetical protein